LAGGQGGDVTERKQAGFWAVGVELPANRALMRRAAAGKLSLDLDKKGVYASYTLYLELLHSWALISMFELIS